jgi:hypothetical protein
MRLQAAQLAYSILPGDIRSLVDLGSPTHSNMVDKGDKRPVANLNQHVRINAWELLSHVVRIVSTASKVRILVRVSEGLLCVPNNVEYVVIE